MGKGRGWEGKKRGMRKYGKRGRDMEEKRKHDGEGKEGETDKDGRGKKEA